MNKYNRSISIPIESLSNEELKIAIKEWAEGDNSMETLLWTMYNLGIQTNGSHAGSHPYMSIIYDKNKIDLIKKIMNITLIAKDTQVLISTDGGNPFSGDNWYKPNILIGSNNDYKNVADMQFDMLKKGLNNEIEIDYKVDTTSILNFLDFLINKYSRFLLRIEHKIDDEYYFSIERSVKEESDEFIYLNKFFSKIGFELKIPPEGDYKYWTIHEKKSDLFTERIKKVVEYIVNNYSLNSPSSFEEANDLLTKAHFKRNESLKQTGSLDEFQKWLVNEKRKITEERKTITK